MKVSLECKLHFRDEAERKVTIEAMRRYSQAVKYGVKCLKPTLEARKQVYKILTEKFPGLPARTVSLAVEEDIAPIINSMVGLEAKNFPLAMRFDKDNSEFMVDEEMGVVRVRFAVERPEKGRLNWVVADLMPIKSLSYKYYKHLFTTKKGYKLPWRLMMRNGQLYGKVTVEREKLLADSTKPTVYVGIDLRAHWLGTRHGNPLAVAFLNPDGSFARQPILMHEWSRIPVIIRQHQRQKRKMKKILTNQIGIIIKQIRELCKDYNPIFKIEDLTGLRTLKGAYSKFCYRRFRQVLEAKSLNIALINPAYTTRKCSRCGKIGKTEKRTFYCPQCYPRGFNKFINAAINIAKS